MTTQNLRKIIKIEYNRLVTLPLFWLSIVELDAGDLVEISLGKTKEFSIKPKKVRKNG